MSMISELVKELEELEGWEKTTDEPKAKLIREAISVIQELSEKLHAANMERSSRYYNGGWIKFEYRYDKDLEQRILMASSLPDDGQEVLVSLKSGDVDKDTFLQDGTECYFDSGYDFDDVVAWMPLPEPYRKEEQDEMDSM